MRNQIELLGISLEPEKGRTQELDIDSGFLSRSPIDFRDFTYPNSRYWVKSGIAVGLSHNEYPIARIYYKEQGQFKIARHIDGVCYTSTGSAESCMESIKSALSQVGPKGARRLLQSLKDQRWPNFSSVFVRDGVGEPIIEALPEEERDSIIKQSYNWHAFSDDASDAVRAAWRRSGKPNIDLEFDGYPWNLLFITRRTFIKVISEIADGKVVKIGRFICPNCGKNDIKSKSGYTLHLKKCNE